MKKPPGQQALHDMMARQQQQMADYQRRGGQLTWMKQEEERKKQEDAKQSGQVGAQTKADSQSGGYFQPDDQFSKVEAEVARLNTLLVAGKLSEVDFNERLSKLMVQDTNGEWWMVGAKTGGWYRYDGRSWVQSSPPGHYVQNSTASLNELPLQEDFTRPKRHPFKAIIVFVFLLWVGLVAGWLAGIFSGEVLQLGNSGSFVVAVIVWLVGLIFTIKLTRRTWRGT